MNCDGPCDSHRLPFEEPCRKLIASVLQLAVSDACHPRPRSREGTNSQASYLTGAAQAQARRWIERGDSGRLTFNQCCEVLEIDPEIVRDTITKHPDSVFRSMASMRVLQRWTVRRHASEPTD